MSDTTQAPEKFYALAPGGKLKGFFSDHIMPRSAMPEGVFEVSNALREEWHANQFTVRWDGSKLVPSTDAAPVFVPPRVTRFQARTILRRTPSPTGTGTLFALLEADLFAGKDVNEEGAIAWEAWTEAGSYERAGRLINQLSAKHGLSQAFVDELFIAADRVSV
jgi:hypothetical protein